MFLSALLFSFPGVKCPHHFFICTLSDMRWLRRDQALP